jgi:hypothetical protein
VHSDSTVD